LILQYKELKKKNNELIATVETREKRIRELEESLKEAKDDFKNLKLARMIEVSDGDIEESRKRIAKLIRDVNKCITLLSE
jgi:ribosomal protein L29